MKAAIGGGIALILLGLYGYSVLEAIRIAMSPEAVALKSGFVSTMNTVGGLVSALVISELAITQPGQMPAKRMGAGWVPWIASAYIAAWAALGLAAYVAGVMLYEGKIPALTDYGLAWLGLAVASGYAYFGLGRAHS